MILYYDKIHKLIFFENLLFYNKLTIRKYEINKICLFQGNSPEIRRDYFYWFHLY